MDDKIRESWERFLNPESLRGNLILASLYIATFEILKNSIIGRIKDFYSAGFDENGKIIDHRYESEVLTKNRSLVYASLMWLKDSNVINDEDIALFNRVKEFRNAVAHEIARMLSEGLPSEFPERFSEMGHLLNKIEIWWIINVEITTDPNLFDQGIEESEIIPGPIASLKMMINIALGSEDEAKAYYDEFIKTTREI